MGCGVGDGSRGRWRRKKKGDCERARERLRDEVSSSPGMFDTDLIRFLDLGLLIERPRVSSTIEGATLSFVLVRERDKDDKPPIIELKDILPNEPADDRLVISGAFRDGEVGRGPTASAEIVRWIPLSVGFGDS